MRFFPLLALASLSLTACVPSGQYDSNGVYHAYGTGDSSRTSAPRNNGETPGGDQDQYQNRSEVDIYRTGNRDVPTTTTIIYDRPGVYDYNRYYISSDQGPDIPGRYFPPKGMCRVWFTDRPLSAEPPVESCSGIDGRVPTGAYVVYGG